MTTKNWMSAAALGIALAASGCAFETPRVDSGWGNSVRSMIQGQTLDPAAAANPAPAAPEVGDGQRLQAVVDVYRKDVSQGSQEVQRDIVINVGD